MLGETDPVTVHRRRLPGDFEQLRRLGPEGHVPTQVVCRLPGLQSRHGRQELRTIAREVLRTAPIACEDDGHLVAGA